MIQKKDTRKPCNLTFKSQQCINKVNSEKCLIDKNAGWLPGFAPCSVSKRVSPKKCLKLNSETKQEQKAYEKEEISFFRRLFKSIMRSKKQ